MTMHRVVFVLLGAISCLQACANVAPCRLSTTDGEEKAALAVIHGANVKTFGQSYADGFLINRYVSARQTCGAVVRLRFDPKPGVLGVAEEYDVDIVARKVSDHRTEDTYVNGKLEELILEPQTTFP